MRNVLRLVGLFGFLAFLPFAHATGATGTWKGAFDFQGTSVPLTFHLTTAAGAVTGTVEGLPTTPAEIHEGKVDGDAITFWVDTDYEGTTYRLVYKGKISQGQIDFIFGTDDGSWGAELTAKNSDLPVAAEKPSVPDLTGSWKGAFDFQGTSIPLTFHLTAAAGVVTGTVEGLPTTPAEIHEGKLDGDTLSFSVNTDYEGQTYMLVYKGKVSADGIKFTFGTDDGSWGAELTATKTI
jgi:hypothetical protein